MTVAVVDAELFREVVAGGQDRPGGRIGPDFFGRFVKCVHELFVLLLGEFDGTIGLRLIVDDVLERSVSSRSSDVSH